MRDAMPNLNNWLRNTPPILGIAVLGILATFYGTPPQQKSLKAGQERLRIGYFPNVTHAPAIVAMARDEFQKAVGDNVIVEAKVFTDGPTAMEALLAGELDMSYCGPSPAINTFVKSQGRAIRIVSGACSGGAGLVARSEANIANLHDLDGKRVAVPQFGGTQDISLRHFLAKEGLRGQEQGGTVQIMPVKPADVLALFASGQLDAAWVPEPWTSRLLKESKSHLVADERDLWPDKRFLTTVIVTRKSYLDQSPDKVKAILRAHLRTLDWLQKNPAAAQETVNREMKRLTGKSLPADTLREAWGRVEFSADPIPASLEAFAQGAIRAGYLTAKGLDITELLDLRLLDSLQAQQAGVAGH